MSNGETWVVPGAPLDEGAGWRIWYSRTGTADFTPQAPTVLLGRRPQEITTRWDLLPPYEGLHRRMGVLEVELDPGGRRPGDTYEILVPEAALRQLRWKTLPDSIEGAGVSFIWSSCFWLPNDKDGSFAAGIRALTKLEQPAFKLMTGDQVYQDWPPNLRPKGDAVARFARRYEQYWGHPAYQEVLTSSPNYFSSDDHEFWNGYPEPALQNPFTLTGKGYEANRRAGLDLFHHFQTAVNPHRSPYFSFSVGPVSFFVTDCRSERTRLRVDEPHFFGADQWEKLESWVNALDGPGVLVLAQPLFGKKGDWKEPAMRDFEEDHARLCTVFETALTGTGRRAKHDVLILTGDIHRARHFKAVLAGAPGDAAVHEIVSSAAARIGPDLVRPHVDDKPLKFTLERDGQPRTWDAGPEVVAPPWKLPSPDNNVGIIRMSPGTRSADTGEPRVRFTIAVWSLRPFARAWSRLLPRRKSGGTLVKLYETELELR